MRKSLIITGVATILAILMAIDTNSHVRLQPHLYVLVSWLAVTLGLGVFTVMVQQFLVHGRQIHLFLGIAFFQFSIFGIRESLLLPETLRNGGNGCWDLWQLGWLVLSLMLIAGVFQSRRVGTRSERVVGALVMSAACAFFGALFIYILFSFYELSGILSSARIGLALHLVTMLALAGAAYRYTRPQIHKGSPAILWLGYGTIAGAAAQLAILCSGQVCGGAFGAAMLLKAVFLASPLVGMLAEYVRLQSRYEEQATDFTKLVQVQQAVNSITIIPELYQRVVELIASAFPVCAVCLMPFDRDRSLLSVASTIGMDDYLVRQLVFRPGEGPAGNAYSDREVVFVRDVALDRVLSEKLGAIGAAGSAVFSPLMAKEECYGVLALFFPERVRRNHRLSKDQLRLLDAISSVTAIAVYEDHLRHRMANSYQVSNDYSRDLEIMWETGQAVASGLDANALISKLSDRLRDAVGATSCAILAYESDAADLSVAGDRKMVRRHAIANHTDRCDDLASLVAVKGQPFMFADIPNSSRCKYPELAVDDGGKHHILAVPMSLRGFCGAILVFRQNGEPFGDREERLLMRLAPIVAVGIRNAELYERDQRIADGLAKSFLPELGRDLPGLRVAAKHQSALDDSLIGSDFYDVIPLGDGRYGVTIGDGSGRGVGTAVHTALTRYMIQAYSDKNPDPLYVVQRLNADLCRYTPVGRFATLVYGIIDTNRKTFTYVNAGHEQPFIYIGSSGKITNLLTTGPAAGALIEAEYAADEIVFEPGDMLILYTDGAVDAVNEGKPLGADGLSRFVATHIRKSPHDLPEAVLSSIQSYSSGPLRDDIALLIIEACTPGGLF